MLITLAIIGIVAALTIPSVVANYQHTQYISGLKKVQSTISSAAYMYIAQGGIISADVSGNGRFDATDYARTKAASISGDYSKVSFFEGIAKNLQTISSNADLSDITISDLNGDSTTLDYNHSIFLKDGATIKFGASSKEFITDNGLNDYQKNPSMIPAATLMVDVNGPFKKPNKIGYDVFGFLLLSKGQVVPAGANFNEAITAYQNKGNCLAILAEVNKSWCATSSALKGENPDGTEYWKGIKYWEK